MAVCQVPSGATRWKGELEAAAGAALRVMESDCPGAVGAVDKAAGARRLPLALPGQVGHIHAVALEIGHDES